MHRLLGEVAFQSIFAAPVSLRSGLKRDSSPSAPILLMMRFLALRAHLETALPYARKLPRWLNVTIELMPFLALIPRRLRRLSYLAFTLTRLLTAALGDRASINVLAPVLNLWLLDDEALTRYAAKFIGSVAPMPKRELAEIRRSPAPRPSQLERDLSWIVAIPILAVSALGLLARFEKFRSKAIQAQRKAPVRQIKTVIQELESA